jgi:hypothetical protein
MKKFLTAVFILTFSLAAQAQIDLMGGMGISFQSTPSLKDYIDNVFTGGEELADFSSAVTFFFESDYEVNPTFDLGVEYEAQIYSWTWNVRYFLCSPQSKCSRLLRRARSWL